MPFNVTALLLGVVAALNLWLGISIYKRAPRVDQGRSFALMAASISLWTVALTAAHYGHIANTLALRLAFAFAALIPISVVAFVEYLHERPLNQRVRICFVLPVGFILSIISLGPWIVVSVTPTVGGTVVKYGALH